ncbi:unnamed protein product [Sphagnum jensenii]|uniref:Uncharacterized protein n=1 Tax=Sphagnum jensenii TaxID=128206 RepID=A0ABP1B9F3_9BRYO
MQLIALLSSPSCTFLQSSPISSATGAHHDPSSGASEGKNLPSPPTRLLLKPEVSTEEKQPSCNSSSPSSSYTFVAMAIAAAAGPT